MIPKQLQNPEFRFCLLKPKEKIPFEKNWQKKGYTYDSPKLLEHIKNGGNYGIIGGFGNLRILDIDDPILAKELEKKLPVFIVKTGGGGKHFYFISFYNKNHVLANEKGELRANNYQVVGAGSTHPNGNKYEVYNDIQIPEIATDLLKMILEPYIRKEPTIITTLELDKKKDTSRSGLEYRKVLALIKEGKTKEQIFQEMMAYSKWATAPVQYRETTYQKALAFTEQTIDEETIKKICKEVYPKLIQILKEYCDLKEEHYNLIALWIIGTYLHKGFRTFPYLYFNAMRGSGKSRLLNLIAYLSKNGKIVVNMSEAVLFRTAENSTLCIDEFERVGSKEKQALRELLNAGYKKGAKVQRIKKIIDKSGEKYGIEEFNVFCPVAMANIWGMDEVLSDRSISLIIEKSSNPNITRKLEIWEMDDLIKHVKGVMMCIDCSDNCKKNIYKLWNSTLSKNTSIHNYTHTTYTTYDTQHYNYTNFVNKLLEKTTLDSRSLELFFPLFIIAEDCGVLDEIIEIAEKIVKEKKEEDIFESKDVALIDFVAEYPNQSEDYLTIRTLIKEFKTFLLEGDEDVKWLNSRWFGVALKRLNLVKKKRRTRSGVEVILDFEIAKRKIKMFKGVP